MENNKKRKPSFYLWLVGIVSALSMGVVGLKNQGDIIKYEQANKQANERILDQQEEFRRQLGEIRDSLNTNEKEVNFEGAQYDVVYDLLDLTKNPARTGEKIEGPKKIMIHDTGTPGATAEQIGRYLKNRVPMGDARYSDIAYHCCIDYKTGEVRIFIPFTEKALVAPNMNDDTIHIVLTNLEGKKEYTEKQMQTLVDVSARLCETYEIDPNTGIIRHNDIDKDRRDPECMSDSTKETSKSWEEYKQNVNTKIIINKAYEEYKALRSFGYNHTQAVGRMTQDCEKKVIDNEKIK